MAATLAISKNTGGLRFFVDTIAAGIVRDVDGNVAVFKAHGSDFLDVQTGQIYGSGAAPGPTNAYVFGGNAGITDTDAYDGTTWTSKANLAQGRYSSASFSIGEKCYVAGGKSGSATVTVSSFDGTTQATLSNMPSPVRYTHWATIIGAVGFCFGGYTGSARIQDNDSFDASSWTNETSLPSPARNAVTAQTLSSIAYCIGGSTGGLLSDVDAWNLTSWSAATSLPSPARQSACAGLLAKIYCIGGYSGIRDPSNDSFDGTSWVAETDISPGRSGMACSNIGSSIYMSGGYTTGAISTVQSFDGTSYTSEANLPSPARDASTGSSL